MKTLKHSSNRTLKNPSPPHQVSKSKKRIVTLKKYKIPEVELEGPGAAVEVAEGAAVLTMPVISENVAIKKTIKIVKWLKDRQIKSMGRSKIWVKKISTTKKLSEKTKRAVITMPRLVACRKTVNQPESLDFARKIIWSAKKPSAKCSLSSGIAYSVVSDT